NAALALQFLIQGGIIFKARYPRSLVARQHLLIGIVSHRGYARDSGIASVHLHQVPCALKSPRRTRRPAARHQVVVRFIHRVDSVLAFASVERLVLLRGSHQIWIGLLRREPSDFVVTLLVFGIVVMPLIRYFNALVQISTASCLLHGFLSISPFLL